MKNEIILSFCIWGFEDCTPDDITRATGLTPVSTYVKGEKKNPKFAALAKQNGWILGTPYDKYTPFDQQMNYLSELLAEKKEVFKPLCDQYYCEFSCALFVYAGNGESTPWVHLSRQHNSLLKELDIEFDLDLYCYSDSDSEAE